MLIAEDDADVREVLVETLEGTGYDVTAVADGTELMAVLQRGVRPLVILLDLLMPGMDGWEFLSLRSRRPDLESIPVIVISGERDVEEKVVAAHAGFVPKPVPLERLFATMERECGALARRG